MNDHSSAPAPRPFEGVRIVDTTHVLAGPYCTYQLALLGADVIKVENPDRSKADMIRGLGPIPTLNEIGMGAHYLSQNANKRSIALDLKHPDARTVFERMVAGADVLVENYRPGVMERLGFGYEAARAVNPRLIYASITGFGQEGPMAHAPAYDHILQAVSGLMDLVGTAEEPMRVRFPLIDYATGLSAAFAISAALHQRTHTDRGQRVDVSMLDAALILMTSRIADVLAVGDVVRPEGNTAASGSPFSGFFPTAEGTLAVTANTYQQAVRLCECIGRPDLLEDPRIARWSEHPELAAELQPVFETLYRSAPASEWEERLSAAGVPAGRVRGLPEVLAGEQTRGRDSVLPAGRFEPLDRDLEVPGVGFKLEHGGAEVTRLPPALGEHGDEILDELGIDAETRARMRGDGALI